MGDPFDCPSQGWYTTGNHATTATNAAPTVAASTTATRGHGATAATANGTTATRLQQLVPKPVRSLEKPHVIHTKAYILNTNCVQLYSRGFLFTFSERFVVYSHQNSS